MEETLSTGREKGFPNDYQGTRVIANDHCLLNANQSSQSARNFASAAAKFPPGGLSLAVPGVTLSSLLPVEWLMALNCDF